jgi:hypothetical protein
VYLHPDRFELGRVIGQREIFVNQAKLVARSLKRCGDDRYELGLAVRGEILRLRPQNDSMTNELNIVILSEAKNLSDPALLAVPMKHGVNAASRRQRRQRPNPNHPTESY